MCATCFECELWNEPMTEVYLPPQLLDFVLRVRVPVIELVLQRLLGRENCPDYWPNIFGQSHLESLGVTRHSSLVSLVAVRPCSAAAHDHGCGIGILARLRAIRFPEAASLRSQLRPKDKELKQVRHETCRRRLGTPRDEQDTNHKNHVGIGCV